MTPPAASACGRGLLGAAAAVRRWRRRRGRGAAGRILTCPRPRGHVAAGGGPAVDAVARRDAGGARAGRVPSWWRAAGLHRLPARRPLGECGVVDEYPPSRRIASRVTELLARAGASSPSAPTARSTSGAASPPSAATPARRARAAGNGSGTVLQRLIDRLLTQPPYVALPDVRVPRHRDDRPAAASAGGWHRVACPGASGHSAFRRRRWCGRSSAQAARSSSQCRRRAPRHRRRRPRCRRRLTAATTRRLRDVFLSSASRRHQLERCGGGGGGGGSVDRAIADESTATHRRRWQRPVACSWRRAARQHVGRGSTTFGAFINSFGQRTAAPAPGSAPPPPGSAASTRRR